MKLTLSLKSIVILLIFLLSNNELIFIKTSISSLRSAYKKNSLKSIRFHSKSNFKSFTHAKKKKLLRIKNKEPNELGYTESLVLLTLRTSVIKSKCIRVYPSPNFKSDSYNDYCSKEDLNKLLVSLKTSPEKRKVSFIVGPDTILLVKRSKEKNSQYYEPSNMVDNFPRNDEPEIEELDFIQHGTIIFFESSGFSGKSLKLVQEDIEVTKHGKTYLDHKYKKFLIYNSMNQEIKSTSTNTKDYLDKISKIGSYIIGYNTIVSFNIFNNNKKDRHTKITVSSTSYGTNDKKEFLDFNKKILSVIISIDQFKSSNLPDVNSNCMMVFPLSYFKVATYYRDKIKTAKHYTLSSELLNIKSTSPTKSKENIMNEILEKYKKDDHPPSTICDHLFEQERDEEEEEYHKENKQVLVKNADDNKGKKDSKPKHDFCRSCLDKLHDFNHRIKSVIPGNDILPIVFNNHHSNGQGFLITKPVFSFINTPAYNKIISMAILKQNCIMIFTEEHYKGERFKICASLDNLFKASQINKIGSIAIGPNTIVELYEKENFKNQVATIYQSLDIVINQQKSYNIKSFKITTTSAEILLNKDPIESEKCALFFDKENYQGNSKLLCGLTPIVEISQTEFKFKSIKVPENYDLVLFYSTKSLFFFKSEKSVLVKQSIPAVNQDKVATLSHIEVLKEGCVIFFNKQNYSGKFMKICEASSNLSKEKNYLFEYKSVLVAENTKVAVYDLLNFTNKVQTIDTLSKKLKDNKVIEVKGNNIIINESIPDIGKTQLEFLVNDLSSVHIVNDEVLNQSSKIFNSGNRITNFFVGLVSGFLFDSDKHNMHSTTNRDKIKQCIPEKYFISSNSNDRKKRKGPEDEDKKTFISQIENYASNNLSTFTSYTSNNQNKSSKSTGSLLKFFRNWFCNVRSKFVEPFNQLINVLGLMTDLNKVIRSSVVRTTKIYITNEVRKMNLEEIKRVGTSEKIKQKNKMLNKSKSLEVEMSNSGSNEGKSTDLKVDEDGYVITEMIEVEKEEIEDAIKQNDVEKPLEIKKANSAFSEILRGMSNDYYDSEFEDLVNQEDDSADNKESTNDSNNEDIDDGKNDAFYDENDLNGNCQDSCSINVKNNSKGNINYNDSSENSLASTIGSPSDSISIRKRKRRVSHYHSYHNKRISPIRRKFRLQYYDKNHSLLTIIKNLAIYTMARIKGLFNKYILEPIIKIKDKFVKLYKSFVDFIGEKGRMVVNFLKCTMKTFTEMYNKYAAVKTLVHMITVSISLISSPLGPLLIVDFLLAQLCQFREYKFAMNSFAIGKKFSLEDSDYKYAAFTQYGNGIGALLSAASSFSPITGRLF